MPTSELVIDGVAFLCSREAAKLVELSPDYISRLARAGVIHGRLLANQWFVSIPSLQVFSADHERRKQMSRARLAGHHRAA
jgi:hypothetical protein